MDETAKKRILRMIPYTLFVIGVKSGEEIGAFTGSWLTQVSFHPPMVAISVKKKNRSHELLMSSKAFSINLLDETQKTVAQHFFTAPRSEMNRLSGYAYREGSNGCPLLDVAFGQLECETRETADAGDHTLFIGEILAARLLREGSILNLKETGWHYGG